MSPQKVVKDRLNNSNLKCPLLSHSLVRIHFFKIVNVWRLEYVKGREHLRKGKTKTKTQSQIERMKKKTKFDTNASKCC